MGHINGFSSSFLDSLGSFSFAFSSATGVDCLEGREYCEDAKLSERGEEKEEVEVVVDGDESVRERDGGCVDEVEEGGSVELNKLSSFSPLLMGKLSFFLLLFGM